MHRLSRCVLFVTNRPAVFSLYRTAKDFGQRPSDLMNITDEWAGWQLDNAVSWFGNWVESKLAETDKHGNSKHKLNDLLNGKRKTKADAIKFLAGLFGGIEKR